MVLQGSIYQMINHGLSTGALFVCGFDLSEAADDTDVRVWRRRDADAGLFDSLW